ncbi:MAG: sugar ABC transporter permease [Bauldia sp.]|nr:sugar ABC transporter permease [Bauldia sp.]
MRDTRILAYLLLLPATAYLAVFFVYPFVQVGITAFAGPDGLTLSHARAMVNDWRFAPALRNTVMLAAIIVPLQLVMALAMASLVMRLGSGRDTILYIWTIPLGISDLASGLIWLAILNQTGFLNSFLAAAGLMDEPVNWLSYRNTGFLIFAVVIAELWRSTAIVMVILVAGMGLIPKAYYEAAEVFGAGPWKRFTKITLPLLRPSLQTALILRTILALEVFGVVAALAGTNLPVLLGETFTWQFALQDGPVASAFALVTLAISVGATIAYLWLLRTPEEVKA